jgi:hypothetical protein
LSSPKLLLSDHVTVERTITKYIKEWVGGLFAWIAAFSLICRSQRGIASPTNSSINFKTSGWFSATLLILP